MPRATLPLPRPRHGGRCSIRTLLLLLLLALLRRRSGLFVEGLDVLGVLLKARVFREIRLWFEVLFILRYRVLEREVVFEAGGVGEARSGLGLELRGLCIYEGAL
jgi:hypothetical protein